MTVDKNSNLPMHQQLYLNIKEKIEKGEYKEHSQIPSESEIQSMYKISRVTVRRAISDLERDGFVKKRKGAGPYVLPQKKYKDYFAFRGFSEDVAAHGQVPGSIILKCKKVEAGVRIGEILQVPPDEQVGYLKRLRLVDGRIAALHETYISLRFGFDINPDEFNSTTSLYEFYETHGVELSCADETLEVRMPSAGVKAEMFLTETKPLFYRERVSFAADGRPVEFSLNYTDAERHKYSIHLERTRKKE